MSSMRDHQRLYQDLAQECERRRDSSQGDVFFVLAADCALSDRRAEDAEQLRQCLLEASPHSLLRPFASFAEAMESRDIREYVEDLRHQFPPDWSERLLASWRRESQAKEPDSGQSPSVLDSLFGSEVSSAADPFAAAESPGFVLPADFESPRRSDFPRGLASEPVAKPIQAVPSPPKAPAPEAPSLKPSAARPPKKKRRDSPYDNPDYGPPLPKRSGNRSFFGSAIIYLLIGLVTLAGVGLLGYVLARPFLNM